MKFAAESPDGRPVDLFIARVEPRDVYVDTNHPFAGLALSYEIEIIDVRDRG
jgi:FKBP-type peptidyl-prolyl cis-trans isomerase SlyD